jgi:hypothetical protein
MLQLYLYTVVLMQLFSYSCLQPSHVQFNQAALVQMSDSPKIDREEKISLQSAEMKWEAKKSLKLADSSESPLLKIEPCEVAVFPQMASLIDSSQGIKSGFFSNVIRQL